MFDKQAVDAYRSTTAPVQLKEQVMNAVSQPKRQSAVRLIPMIGTIAACVALIVFGTVYFQPDQPTPIISSDWSLSEQVAPASTGARTGDGYIATFTVAFDGKIQVETDDTIFVKNIDGTLESAYPYQTSDVVVLCWCVTSPDATVIINGDTYTLIADEENGSFTIVQD